MISLTLLVVTGFLALEAPAEAGGHADLSPTKEYQISVAGVRHVLAPYKTMKEVTGFVGGPLERCVSVSPRSSICVWALSKRQEGWRPLASALGTRDRLNLICEFPLDGGARSKDSCSVHSQRSSRKYYRTFKSKTKGQRKRPDARTEANTVAAQELIDNARTAFELSTLVGDAPYQCNEVLSHMLCVWKTDARTYGHGTLAMTIGASFSKKVRLSCTLPINSEPRDPNSCAAQVGT